MKNYVEYITDVTCKLLAIDSPTGYTKNAAEFVMEEYRKLGYEPQMTVKGCVLVDIGGKNKDNGIVLAKPAELTKFPFNVTSITPAYCNMEITA